MRIAAEHLLHKSLAIFVESTRKTARLADPVFTCRVGGTTCCLVVREGFRDTIDFFCRKHHRVIDFTDNPLLDTVDKLGSRDLSSLGINEPSVRQA